MRPLSQLLVLLFVTVMQASAQEKELLFTGSFENSTVPRFLRTLEATSSYYFYYDSLQLDSFRITLSIQNQPLQPVLEAAFKNTDIRFAVDAQDHVFISRQLQMLTTLPAGFGDEKPALAKSNNVKERLTMGDEKRKALKTGSENKLYEIGAKTDGKGGGKAILTGYVRNAKSGEPVVGASVSAEGFPAGVITDQYGYYSITVPPGSRILNVQGLGMKDARYQLLVHADGTLDIEQAERVVSLKEVIVSSQKVVNVTRVQMGLERLTMQTIKLVPTVFGEADILRVVLTLPGVKTVGEASTGFNVRGGSADQNLILFNDATIYNPSHFFGLFSAFNPDVMKEVELYKSSIPARFGGRLASVLDITGKEGNKKKLSGVAGIGLLTSRLNIEGPITKDKTSFVLGGRTTYANWLLNLLPGGYKNSKAAFNDVNAIISHRINAKNDLYVTGYVSNDRFNLNSDTAYGYSNRDASLKWKHSFSNKLSGVFTAAYDKYQYHISSRQNPVNAYRLAFDINQLNFKTDFNYYINAKHTLDFGTSTLRYQLHPGNYKPIGKESLAAAETVPAEQAFESAMYIADRYTINSKFSVNAGVRYSLFNNMGPQAVNVYADGLPKEEGNIIDVKTFSKGHATKTYGGPEYRFSLRYALNNSFSVKGGYNTLRQYIHVLSNTAAIAPTDIWKLSDPNIKPQRGNQVSVGLYKNLKSNSIETSVEVYYKKIRDYLDYKPGATLELNQHIETEVINTQGKAYGVELMVKKQAGKLNGWASYTYSRVLLKMDDPTAGAVVNSGAFYPANYDKPHDATLIGNFRVNHRFSLSWNVTYSTGRPITLPVGRYYYAGSQRILYSDRNAYRIPDYFRTDFSMNIEGNHKVAQKTHNSWTIGVYNLTGRKNPYSVYFTSENGLIKGYKLSIFGSVIPFINFNIRF